MVYHACHSEGVSPSILAQLVSRVVPAFSYFLFDRSNNVLEGYCIYLCFYKRAVILIYII